VGAKAKKSPLPPTEKGSRSKSSQEDASAIRSGASRKKGSSQETKIKASGADGDKGNLAPIKKVKSVHYSTMQNKPVAFASLEHLRNRLMFSIDVPRYFCFDLIETKPVFET